MPQSRLCRTNECEGYCKVRRQDTFDTEKTRCLQIVVLFGKNAEEKADRSVDRKDKIAYSWNDSR